MCVDLPQLSLIISSEMDNFGEPRTVILESLLSVGRSIGCRYSESAKGESDGFFPKGYA